MAGAPGKNNIKRIFSLTSIGVILLAIVIAANGILLRNNEGKRVQIDDLNSEISQVQQNIAGTPQAPDDLESRLAAVEAELAAAKNTFPSAVNRNDVIDYIINVAAECRVQVIPLVVMGWAPGNTGQSYRILRFSTTVIGHLEDTNAFMTRLQKGEYPTLIITECTVQRVEDVDVSDPERNAQVMVDLSIALYVSSPTADGGSA